MVTPIPEHIPAIAALLLILLENIPIMSAGNIDAAAKPKASATVPAAKSGGYKPNQP